MIVIKFWYIFPAILVFGFLIFIHEFGHFLCARAFGVGIKEFSIGMGPRLGGWTSKKGNIQYSVRALPIGGYVSMLGEDEEWLLELADQLEPEDGCLWIYDTDDRATLGFTERGIESLKELSLDQKR